MRGRQGKEDPRTEGRIHRRRDQKKQRRTDRQKQMRKKEVVVLVSAKKSKEPLVEVDENCTFVLTKVLNMKYLLKIWWLVVWGF